MMRAVAAIVAGYLTHALGLSGLVLIWFVEGLVPSGAWSVSLLIVALAVLGLVTGAIVGIIASRRSRSAALITAGLVAAVGLGT